MADTGLQEDPSSSPGDSLPFFSFFLFLSSSNPCSWFKNKPSVLYFSFKGPIHHKLAQHKNPRWRHQPARGPEFDPWWWPSFFSFFLFLSFYKPCSWFKNYPSVLYFVIQGQIAPKLAQHEHPRWRTPASERTRVRSLVMAFLFSLFSFSFTLHLFVRCSRNRLRSFVSRSEDKSPLNGTNATHPRWRANTSPLQLV